MTIADTIRNMSDGDLASLLIWGCVPYLGIEVPDCSEGCKSFAAGCANGCSREKQEMNVRKWLEEERR